ncbi:MAG: glucose-6-phosphate isomerase [Candidatus Gracilibacteria bacterium]|nr:glucose-6-phosphate isomerase [Candidatus Gracilibacteria bacterium]
MIKINTNNLSFSAELLESKYKDISNEAIKGLIKKYDNNELGFIDLDINHDIEKINTFVAKNKDNFDSIVVLGIGGSALGTRAIMTALKGKFYNELSKEKRNNFPKLYILDNVDPIEISQLIEVIDYSRTLFIIISKSGGTLETISQFQFFKEKVEEKNLDYKKHFVVIAGENSSFKNDCLKKGLEVFDIPENVGGRFSVFTNVGLLPLAFIGIDIEKLLKGITNLKTSFFETDFKKNPALLTAIIQYHTYSELGKNINVIFPYISNFSYFGQWCKQLIGESLGKKDMGVTVVDAIGVTDQHSQLQLYYEGPNDKLLVFIELEKFENDLKISNLYNLKFEDLMHTEMFGTQTSITNYDKLNYTITLDRLCEEVIGELFFLYEFQTAILGEFYKINAFNQPGVEIGKNITKQRLEEQFGKIDLLNGKIN